MPGTVEFRFGRFTLSPGKRQLLGDGQPIRIGSLAFDLLSQLVERAGNVIEKRELIERAWTAAEADEVALRSQIAALRRILGDGQDGSRYIANISGRGYAFVMAVNRIESNDHHSSTPPLKRGSVRNNLPLRLEPMFGRDECIAELVKRLHRTRFLTIVGAPGMGKSTLALAGAEQLSDRFPDGVWLIDLSIVGDPATIPFAIASAMSIELTSHDDALDQLLRSIQRRRSLIVLDNCERLSEAASDLVAGLIDGTTDLCILATSREALPTIAGDVIQLGPLELPDAGEPSITATWLANYSAVRLFVARAQSSDPAFRLDDENAAVVAELCRRLDGMPFAIEVVAARVDSLGLPELLTHVQDRLPLRILGRRNAPDHHSTLTALLDWSYALLTPNEQTLLCSLSVFARRFTKADASVVVEHDCAASSYVAECLSALVARSIVQRVDDGPSSSEFFLLNTTRMYALDKLEGSSDHAAVRRRHIEHLCRTLNSERDKLADGGAETMPEGLDIEVQEALEWADGKNGDPLCTIRLRASAAPLSHRLVRLEGLWDRAMSMN